MTRYLVLALWVGAIVIKMNGAVWPEQLQQAVEGRGLLPQPSAAVPEGTTIAGQFVPYPSGGFSRIVFQTNESPDFDLTVQDFSFPPDQKPYLIRLPSAAFLHLLSGSGEVSVSNNRLALSYVARAAVPAGAPIEVTNNGQYPVLIRALIVEAK